MGVLGLTCKGCPRGFRRGFRGVSAGVPRGFRGVSGGFRGFPRGYRTSGALLWASRGTFAVLSFLYENVHFRNEKHWSGLFPLNPLGSRRGLENVGEQPPIIILNREEGGGMCGGNWRLVQVLEFYRALVGADTGPWLEPKNGEARTQQWRPLWLGPCPGTCSVHRITAGQT